MAAPAPEPHARIASAESSPASESSAQAPKACIAKQPHAWMDIDINDTRAAYQRAKQFV